MQKIDPKKLSLYERVEKLNDMIGQGYFLEAFEKFYSDDVIRQDNHQLSLVGKDACRSQAENMVTGITEFRKAQAKNVIYGRDISVVEWELDYTHEVYGDCKYSHIAIQQWNYEGQIINEIIYNNN